MSLFPSCIVEIFSTVGVAVWTKRAGARYIFIQGVGAGGGAQGGGCAAPAGTIVASSGGQGAPYTEAGFFADFVPATVNVTIGAGGVGSAAQTVSGTPPSTGFAAKGGATSFGTLLFAAPGDQPTFQTGAGFAQLLANPMPPSVANGGGNQGGIPGSTNLPFISTNNGGAAGGSGGGITAGVAQSGNQGGNAATSQTPKASGRNAQVLGGVGTTANDGLNGAPGSDSGVGSPYGAGGGGAGSGMQTAAGVAGAGGNGGYPGGGGGGGGASIFGVSTGGKGGNGAAGLIMVTTYF